MQETMLETTEETREKEISLSDSPARGGVGAREDVAAAWDAARAAFVARNGGRS